MLVVPVDTESLIRTFIGGRAAAWIGRSRRLRVVNPDDLIDQVAVGVESQDQMGCVQVT